MNVREYDLSDGAQYAIENSLTTVADWGGRVCYAPGEGPT
jgi:hypothetical protein